MILKLYWLEEEENLEKNYKFNILIFSLYIYLRFSFRKIKIIILYIICIFKQSKQTYLL